MDSKEELIEEILLSLKELTVEQYFVKSINQCLFFNNINKGITNLEMLKDFNEDVLKLILIELNRNKEVLARDALRRKSEIRQTKLNGIE